MVQLAVHLNALWRDRKIIVGRRALFLRAILGVGHDEQFVLKLADVVVGRVALGNDLSEVADDLAEVFAGGDHAPAADRVESNRDRAVRQEGRGVLRDDGVRVIDTKSEISFAIVGASTVGALGLAGGELVGAQGVFRPKVPRTDAVTTTEDARGFFGSDRRQIAAELGGLLALAQRGADVARHGVVPGKSFVGALDDDDVFFATQRIDDRRLGEGADDVQVNGSYLGVALFAEIVAGGLDILGGATERHKHRVGVFRFVLVDQAVAAAGELRELLAALLDKAEDRLVEIISPGHHAVHVVFLVLHRAKQDRVFQVHHLRHAPALGAE